MKTILFSRKIFVVAGWAALLAMWVPALAGNTPEYISTISSDTVRVEKGEVKVVFTLDLGRHIVNSLHKRILTPMLVSPDGKRHADLPPVVASGRQRAIKEERTAASVQAANPYLVLRGNKAENRVVAYRASLPYEPWMQYARLSLREEVVGCDCGEVLVAEQQVKEQALHYPRVSPSAEMECPRAYTPRQEACDAFLIYPVNRTQLFPDRYGNRAELQKIDSTLRMVTDNPAYMIRSIAIAGYASPEGSYRHNVALAEGRAAALKDYVLNRYKLADTLLIVTPGAENWQGLEEAVRAAELPYKEDILQIMHTVADPDEREEQIRAIGGGTPYAFLRHAVYPGLRKNTFRISYVSRERTPEQARELVFSAPSELNVHEFYTVAQTFYADDPETYAKVLLIAADTYPQHSVANNNAARLSLMGGDVGKAEKYLLRTANEPFTWNNRGVLLWLQGKPEEAVVWWRKAAEAGDTQAGMNLAEVEKRGI